MRRLLLLFALGLLLARPAAAATTIELRVGGALATVLANPGGDGNGGMALPLGYGLGLRLSPMWRIGAFGGMGLFGFVGEARLDHAVFGFANDGPILRIGAGAQALAVRCDAACDTLHADEIPFGVGPHLALGAAWRWSFADDEGGVSVGLSVLAARLESRRSGIARLYVGGTGPWVEVDW